MNIVSRLRAELSPVEKLVLLLALSNAVSLAFYVFRVVSTDTLRYWYMSWNLFLAWLPALFAWWLAYRLSKRPWKDWGNVVIGLLWLGFLPNSFYVLTDYIHLKTTGEINLLYDVVMLFSFVVNGFIAGFLSVYMVHRQLLRRLSPNKAHLAILIVFLLSGFAIYLGRTLRWNTWDIVLNPIGLLFDVTDGVLNPLTHPQMIMTTAIFFVLLSMSYALIYQFAEIARLSKK